MDYQNFSSKVLGGLNEDYTNYLLFVIELIRDTYSNYALHAPFKGEIMNQPILRYVLYYDCFLQWNLISQCLTQQDLFLFTDDYILISDSVAQHILKLLFNIKVLDNWVSTAIQSVSDCILLYYPRNATWYSFYQYEDFNLVFGLSYPQTDIEALQLLRQHPIASAMHHYSMAKRRLEQIGLGDLFSVHEALYRSNIKQQLGMTNEEFLSYTENLDIYFFICFRTNKLLTMRKASFQSVYRLLRAVVSFDALLNSQNVQLQQFETMLATAAALAEYLGIDFAGANNQKYIVGEFAISAEASAIIGVYMPTHRFISQFQQFPYDFSEIFVDYLKNVFGDHAVSRIAYLYCLSRAIDVSGGDSLCSGFTLRLQRLFRAEFNELRLLYYVIRVFRQFDGNKDFNAELLAMHGSELRLLHRVNGYVEYKTDARALFLFTKYYCEQLCGYSYSQLVREAERPDYRRTALSVVDEYGLNYNVVKQTSVFENVKVSGQYRPCTKDYFLASICKCLHIVKVQQLKVYWTKNSGVNERVCWLLENLDAYYPGDSKFAEILDYLRKIASVEPIHQNFYKTKILSDIRATIQPYSQYFAEQDLNLDRTALKWPYMLWYNGKYEHTSAFIQRMRDAADKKRLERRQYVINQQNEQLSSALEQRRERLTQDSAQRLKTYQNAWQKAKFISDLY